MNFSFLSSNIPASPAYGVFISELIRYARASTAYTDFLTRSRILTAKLLQQDYQRPRLQMALRKFCGRYQDIFSPYNVSISTFSGDLFANL